MLNLILFARSSERHVQIFMWECTSSAKHVSIFGRQQVILGCAVIKGELLSSLSWLCLSRISGLLINKEAASAFSNENKMQLLFRRPSLAVLDCTEMHL